MKRCLLLALLWLVPADAAVQSVEDLIARERIVALAAMSLKSKARRAAF